VRRGCGCFTNGYAALKHLEPNVGPLAYWLQINATIYQRLRQISTSGAEGICPNGNGTRDLVCIEKLEGLVQSSANVCSVEKSSGLTSATGKSWNNFSVRKSLYP
jgi:hypothetical protein